MRIFKWLLIVIIIVGLGLFLRGLYLNNLGNIIGNLDLKSDTDNLVFKVNYGGFIPLGTVEIINQGREKFKNKEAYHLHAEAQPAWLVDTFRDIKARADSLVDKEKLHTLKFSYKLTVSGKVKEDKVITYDQKNLIMKKDNVERKILANTQDPLSAIFYLMNTAIEIDQELDLNLNTNQTNYQLLAKVKEERVVKKDNKKLKLYLIKGTVKRRGGSFRHSSEFSLWFLDKPYNLPVLTKVFTNIGPTTVRLTEIK